MINSQMAFWFIPSFAQLAWLTSGRVEDATWRPFNKERKRVEKKAAAADDGVASSRKNTTGAFHLSSWVGVRSGNPDTLPLQSHSCSLSASQYLPY